MKAIRIVEYVSFHGIMNMSDLKYLMYNVQWLGTFDLVHVGSATLYTRTNDTEKKEKLEMERRDFSDCQAVETRRSATGLIRNLQRQSHFSTVEIFK